MEALKKAAVLAASASLLAISFGAPAQAAAGCGELCHFHTAQCNYTPNHPDWGCGQAGGYCYDVQCLPDGFAFSAEKVEKIAAAAEAGDLELAQKLAADMPTLRILKPGQMIFDGPQLAGIPGPEASSFEGVRVACAAPASPAETAPAATDAAPTAEQK